MSKDDWKKVALLAGVGGAAVKVIKPKNAAQWTAIFAVLTALASLGQLGFLG